MPIYEYICKNCGHEMEELQSMKEEPLKTCPICGKDALARLIGSGGGVIFKGSGFYHTDYKVSTDAAKDKKETKKKESKTKAEDKPAEPSSKKADKKEGKKE